MSCDDDDDVDDDCHVTCSEGALDIVGHRVTDRCGTARLLVGRCVLGKSGYMSKE